MAIIEDDNIVNPTIPEAQLQYVVHLPDTHQSYTRFFDGLLIPRPSHSAFFRDLRSFREQTVVIASFTACEPSPETPKDITRAKYREITRTYLASRFAHPWCRKAMAGTGGSKGWWGAEWAATGRKMSQEAKDQEEKLHKLLVPIWIIMRGRMFPGQEIIDTWYEAKLARDEKAKQEREKRQEAQTRDKSMETKGDAKLAKSSATELRPASKQIGTSRSHTNMRQDFWDSEEAEEMEEEIKMRDNQAAHAATSIFRLAAAGVLLESMPRREKWKLRKLLKK